MKIINRFTSETIFECAAETMRETILEAVKQGANLTGANLSDADLSRANLTGANLTRADLSDADLSDADLPVLEQIEKMQIRAAICAQVCIAPEKLDMQHWHSCDTVHCIAGWAVVLHPQGRLLESIYGTSAAAALILWVCEGEIPDFHTDNETAMRWIRGEK